MADSRNVAELQDLETVDYEKLLRDKKLASIENEISLIESESPFLNMPTEVAGLEEKAQYMLYYFLTRNIIAPGTSYETKNNILLSYIMTFDNHKSILEKLFNKVDVLDHVDKNGNEFYSQITEKKDIVLFSRWSMRATRYWNSHSLNTVKNAFRKMLEGNVDRVDILKDAIYDDALYHEDVRVQTQNRKMMIDIEGLKNSNRDLVFNVYTDGGGLNKAKAINNKLGIDRFDMSEVIETDE